MVPKILITGGCGYIGSHVIKALAETGLSDSVVVLDNLSSGFKHALLGGTLIQEDLSDDNKLEQIFAANKFSAVMHFAAHTVVPESVENPLKYYHNNVANAEKLISACQRFGVKNFIFSSSAAVYGSVSTKNISEDHPTVPINPYGRSKWMVEEILKDASKVYDLRFVALRYFNAAGADGAGRIGQMTKNATHLIKICAEAAANKRNGISVFGSDYPTKDGTCIRDYIHVDDIAQAHVQALRYLQAGGGAAILNCGYGQGYSVLDIVTAMKKVSGRDFLVNMEGRRLGDAPEVVADPSKISNLLGWRPRYNDIEYIVRTAYQWEQKLGS